MLKAQNEIRIIWLMLLSIVAIATWFLNLHVFSYLCALALVISVMHYVDLIQQPTQILASQFQQPMSPSSKVPLYLASLLAVVGGIMSWHWLSAVGVTIWIFFFLRWLRRLEQQLANLKQYIEHTQAQLQANTEVASNRIAVQDSTSNTVVAAEHPTVATQAYFAFDLINIGQNSL